MNDVSKSDHLFVLADNKRTWANGASNMIGGKVAFLNSDDFSDNGSIANFFGWSDTRTSTHEFGHLAGLTHEDEDGFRSLMKSGGSGGNLTSGNLRSVLLRRRSLNKGNNFIINPLTGKKSPNTTLVDPYTGKQYNINLFGIILKYKKIK